MIRSALATLGVALLLASPALGQNYELVWQDEFDGTELDLTRWQRQIGTGCPTLCGWGNNELQYYRAENATVSGGFLTITAKEESFGGRNYTSARLRTKERGDWLYGRFEMRAKMPIGQGLWPAFWMLPTDEIYGGWAASGEIDIMEYLGHEPAKIYGTIHYGGEYPGNTSSGQSYTLPSGNFHEEFHVFAIEWDPFEIRWYVDGLLYSSRSSWWSGGGPYPAPFNQRFHLLLNLAVGGWFPGNPDATTQFPQEYVVDYVRVYQKDGAAGCELGFDDMDHADPFNNGWFEFGGSVGSGGIGPDTNQVPPGTSAGASLTSGWGSGGTPGFMGGFGRERLRDLSGMTHFNFWIRPEAGQDYTLEINLQDDDDGDSSIPGVPDGADDEFQYALSVGGTGAEVQAGGGWQRVSIPLDDFSDDGTYHWGGNGVLDPYPTSSGGNGVLVNVVIAVIGESGSNVSFLTDEWTFTRQVSSIDGRLFADLDGDGFDDAGEAGIAGVTVQLAEPLTGQVLADAITAADGSYAFSALAERSYRVQVRPGTLPQPGTPTGDPDGVTTPYFFDIDLGCEEDAQDNSFGFEFGATSAPDSPASTLLRQNVPNPFNPRTTLSFELARAGAVELAILDAAGRRVTTLVNGFRQAGEHRVDWSGRDRQGRPVAGGVYYSRLTTTDGTQIRKLVLLK